MAYLKVLFDSFLSAERSEFWLEAQEKCQVDPLCLFHPPAICRTGRMGRGTSEVDLLLSFKRRAGKISRISRK